MSDSNDGGAAEAQHADLGIEQASTDIGHTTHPDARWFGTAGLGLFVMDRLRQVRRWGGNYLINVGPRPDGTLPDAYYERMAELAALGGSPKLDAQWAKEAT